jgi:hypothetical protein
MRLGGPFVFNTSGAFPVTLAGGEYFYPPPGNYLFALGNQTALQWWDPVAYSWRALASPGDSTNSIDCDGYNYRLMNMSGVTTSALITNAGSGGTNGIGPTQTGTTVSFAAGSSNPGGTAAGYVIIGGALSAPTVTQAGSGFLVPPLILIDPPPQGGIQATATCTLTAGGGISTVTLTNAGAGYTSVPNYYVVPQFQNYPGLPTSPYTLPATGLVQPYVPPGQITNMPPSVFTAQGQNPAFPSTAGALITSGALTGSGTLTGLVVTNYGYGYTTVPGITFANTTGALAGGVAATAIMSWGLTGLTGGSGVGYTVGNVWESSLGLLTPGTTGLNNNNLLQPRPARGVLTSTAGALSIEDPGFGLQKLLVAGNFGVAQGTSIATGSIVFSGITMGGVNDTSILQLMVNS